MIDTLTADDRCDRCPARAVIRLTLEAGELMFCQHHANKFGFVDELERVR